jgi:DNA-binding NtrC family response regulator
MDSEERSEGFLQLLYPGDSSATRKLRADIARLNLSARLNKKPFNRPVLLEGETGAGKEYAAEAICAHWLWLNDESLRQDDLLNDPTKLPLFREGVAEHFYAVSATDLLDEVGLAELVGCVKGAFTGAISDRTGILGTRRSHVLIDEIPYASKTLQGHLLRIVQNRRRRPIGGDIDHEQPITTRLLFAGNLRLDREVALGHFREDLYRRLSDNVIRIPPLRENPERVAELARALNREIASEKVVTAAGKCVLSEKDIEWATAQAWPGNVRQLRATIDNWMSRSLLDRRDVALSECFTAIEEAPDAPEVSSAESDILRIVINALRAPDSTFDSFATFIDHFREMGAAALFHAYEQKLVPREEFDRLFGNNVRTVIDQARRHYNEGFKEKLSRK